MLIGQEGNQFQLGQLLGSGAYASVYKGRDRQTGQVVAVKKMKKMDKNDKQIVEKEISIMKGLKHKNIVEYKTDFRFKGEWYIVLEYCGKGDMDHFKKKIGKIPQHHCRLYVKNILQALVQLHKKKIAHRDLKLANILITDQYQLKLADFGFSKDYEANWLKTFCGTPLSMSPEILRRQHYSEKCDVWSLGVLTFTMLYNRPPYYPSKSDGDGLNGLINAVDRKTHHFDLNVQVSEAGLDFMTQCLQKEQKKRPSTLELLGHAWFQMDSASSVSSLRVNALKGSFTQSPQAAAEKKCKVMLFGVMEEHITQMAIKNGLSKDIIQRSLSALEKYYYSPTDITYRYLLLLTKRFLEWEKREVLLELQATSAKVPLMKLRPFQEYMQGLKQVVGSRLKEMPKKERKDTNLEKDLLIWINKEIERLMDCVDEEQINPKLALLKGMCNFVIQDCENSVLSVTWGEREDLKDLQMKIFLYLEKVKAEQAVEIINEGLSDDEDLESTWLIQHTIRTKQAGKGTQFEMGKLYWYVLNIKSNFGADRTMLTDQFDLEKSLEINS